MSPQDYREAAQTECEKCFDSMQDQIDELEKRNVALVDKIDALEEINETLSNMIRDQYNEIQELKAKVA